MRTLKQRHLLHFSLPIFGWLLSLQCLVQTYRCLGLDFFTIPYPLTEKNATLREYDVGYLRFGGGSFFDYYLVVAKDLEHLDDPESYACGNICPQQGRSRLTGRRLEV